MAGKVRAGRDGGEGSVTEFSELKDKLYDYLRGSGEKPTQEELQRFQKLVIRNSKRSEGNQGWVVDTPSGESVMRRPPPNKPKSTHQDQHLLHQVINKINE